MRWSIFFPLVRSTLTPAHPRAVLRQEPFLKGVKPILHAWRYLKLESIASTIDKRKQWIQTWDISNLEEVARAGQQHHRSTLVPASRELTKSSRL